MRMTWGSLLVGGVLIVGACGSGDAADLPRVEVPSAVAPAPVTDGEVDAQWLAETASATAIPARALRAYAVAESVARAEDCDLGWTTIAAIGRIESIHGDINGSSIGEDGVARPPIVGIALDGGAGVRAIPDSDGGRLDGDAEWDRAVGPMQFIPQTWERWGDGDPQDIDAATVAAARYLCDAGDGLGDDDDWIRAVLTYNNSTAYVRDVAARAIDYDTD